MCVNGSKWAVAAHFWFHKHKFEKEPKLLKHISNRPQSELFGKKFFIYKNKEVAIDFDIPQFNDFSNWWMVTTVNRGRNRPLSLQAADGVNRAPKVLLLKVCEVKLNVKNIYFIYRASQILRAAIDGCRSQPWLACWLTSRASYWLCSQTLTVISVQFPSNWWHASTYICKAETLEFTDCDYC